MNARFLALVPAITVWALLCHARPLMADYITFENSEGSKWGDRQHGTASGVITWSFMNEGTMLDAHHPLVIGGEVNVGAGSSLTGLRSSFDTAYGSNAFDNAISNAFNTWTSASPGRIVFQQVTDNGAVAGDSTIPASSAIDIRIGGFHSVASSGFSYVGAVGYGPPGDAVNYPDALAGDVLINLDSLFMRATGVEDDVFYTGGTYTNDLEGLILHELGHAAIGLGHSVDGVNPGLGDVMYVADFPNCCNFINRQLSAQDIAGAQSVYGVPEPQAQWWTLMAASMLLLSRRNAKRKPWHGGLHREYK